MRLIAATNKNLDDAIRDGTFRADLFFRINVVRIEMPALRDRPDDIAELVHTFLARAPRPRARITDEAMRWLSQHSWPGNVRELANVIERAVALSEHDTIVLEDVRDKSVKPRELDLADAATRLLSLAEVELAYIKQVIAKLDGNMAHAARVLGIDRRTLYRKLGDT